MVVSVFVSHVAEFLLCLTGGGIEIPCINLHFCLWGIYGGEEESPLKMKI